DYPYPGTTTGSGFATGTGGIVIDNGTGGGTGYVPPASTQSYVPPAGTQGYVPPAGTQGYVPPAGTQGYVPPIGSPTNVAVNGISSAADTAYAGVKSLIDQKCAAGCHIPGGTAPTNYTTEQGVQQDATGALSKVQGGTMPPPNS